MRRLKLLLLFSLFPPLLSADSKNPADYPLRIHIFSRSETTFFHARVEEEARGDGRGNVFENGTARAVDFSFDCSHKLRNSFGFETYPAKWKKPNQELTVLLPVFGKTGTYFTCNLKTDMKDFAYAKTHGTMRSEPVADFKDWMIKHNYDPEHGKDVPTGEQPSPAAETEQPAPR